MILQLEGMFLAHQHRPLGGEYCELASSKPAGWGEKSGLQAEENLRLLASLGRIFAMEQLAIRLLEGNVVTKNTAEGEDWLRKCACMGSVPAMAHLGIRLLNGELQQKKDGEGELWLREASQKGHCTSCIELACRLLTGEGITKNPSEATALLEAAAEAGDRLAMLLLHVLGASDVYDVLLENRPQWYWLRRAGGDTARLASIGAYVYGRANSNHRGRVRSWLLEKSVEIFLLGHQQGQGSCAVNLAFLYRRGILLKSLFPNPDALIDRLISQGNPLALMEKALWLASNRNPNQDWNGADALVACLTGSHSVLERWKLTWPEPDSEVHLVIGWLVRHGLTVDPDGLPLQERFRIALQCGFEIAAWLSAAPPAGTSRAA